MLLHLNGKFTMIKLKTSLLLENFILSDSHCQFLCVGQCIYEADLAVSVVSFICDQHSQQTWNISSSSGT